MDDIEQELQEAYRKFSAADAAGDTESARAFKKYAVQLEGELSASSNTSDKSDGETTSNPLWGAASNVLGTLGGVAKLANRAEQFVEDKTGYGVFHNERDGVHFQRTPDDGSGTDDRNLATDTADYLKKKQDEIGYVPSTSVEDVKKDWTNAIPFAAERAIGAIPYLVSPGAALAGAVGEVGNTVESRLENDRRNAPELQDFAYGAASGAADFVANRFLPVAGKGVVRGAGRVATGTGVGAAEGALEDFAAKNGTETQWTPDSLGHAAIEGAGGGLGISGAANIAKGVRMTPSAISKYRNSTSDAPGATEPAMPGMNSFLRRIQKERDASGLDLSDIDPTSLKGAKIAVDNVHTQLRNEIAEEAKSLKSRMTAADGADLQTRLDRSTFSDIKQIQAREDKATFNAISQKSRNKVKNTVSNADGEWLKGKFGDDANRLIRLVDESNALATFSRGGYRGGIMGTAEKLGVNPSTTLVGDMTAMATGGIPPVLTVGRLVADGLDRLTGRRSRLNRAVNKLGKQTDPQPATNTSTRPDLDGVNVRGPAEPLPVEQRGQYYDEALRAAPAPDRIGGSLQAIREKALGYNETRSVRLKADQQITDDEIKNMIRKEVHTHPERYTKDLGAKLEEILAADIITLPEKLQYNASDLLAARMPFDPDLSRKFNIPSSIRAEAYSGESPQGLTAAQRKVLDALFKDDTIGFTVTGKMPGYAATAAASRLRKATEASGKSDDKAKPVDKVKSDDKEDAKRKTAYERGAEANQRTYTEARKDINDSDLPTKVKTDIKAELDNLESNFRDKPGSRQRIVNRLKREHPDHAVLIGKLLKPHVTIAKRNAMRKAASEKAAESLKEKGEI